MRNSKNRFGGKRWNRRTWSEHKKGERTGAISLDRHTNKHDVVLKLKKIQTKNEYILKTYNKITN